eukprot:scaffold7044_cov216-Pinguiococcus_pyrenoidosus.AAC.14
MKTEVEDAKFQDSKRVLDDSSVSADDWGVEDSLIYCTALLQKRQFVVEPPPQFCGSSQPNPPPPSPSRRTRKHAAMMSRSSAATIAALGLVLATAHAEKYLACADSAHEHENAWFGTVLPNITGPDNEGFTPRLCAHWMTLDSTDAESRIREQCKCTSYSCNSYNCFDSNGTLTFRADLDEMRERRKQWEKDMPSSAMLFGTLAAAYASLHVLSSCGFLRKAYINPAMLPIVVIILWVLLPKDAHVCILFSLGVAAVMVAINAGLTGIVSCFFRILESIN